MKKLAFYIFAVPFLFAACKSKCIEDLGYHIARDLTVKPYNEIKVSGPIKLLLHQDSTFKLNISADSNIIDLVKADVSGHELSLKLDPEKYCGKDSIIITAGIGELDKISAGNGGKIYTSSKIYVNDITVNLSGATTLRLEMSARKLVLNNDGATNINLIGQAGVHQLKSKGAINLDAFDFITGVYDINLEGTGKANINVLNDLKVKTSGATEIYYKGNPKNVKKDKAGISKLEKIN